MKFYDEYQNEIPVSYLEEIKAISPSEQDFVNKVTYGCTDEKSELDSGTVENLKTWYNEN